MSMGYGLGGWGSISGGDEIFPSTTAYRTALRPTQPPIQWALEAHSPGVNQPGCEAIPPLPYTSSWHGAKLIKHRDSFTFTFICYMSIALYRMTE
jgi:hypothetical protein